MSKPPPTITWRCGSCTGYRYHLRRGEQTCQPCRDAWAEYKRAYFQTPNGRAAKRRADRRSNAKRPDRPRRKKDNRKDQT